MTIPRCVRRVVERLSRGVVLSRRLPQSLGGARLYVSPDAALRFWRPKIESTDPALLTAAVELVRPGVVVWDVGANVGLFTFAAAGLAGRSGRVIAIEPDPFLAGLLRRSACAAGDSHALVEVLQAAASDRVGVAAFCVAVRGRASNYLKGAGQTQAGGVREEHWVCTVPLDALLAVFPPPQILKIDVEGHTAAVLSGAQGLLEHQRPTILCEVGEEDADAVTALLCSATASTSSLMRTFRPPSDVASSALAGTRSLCP